jgi:hypothetical protein
MADIERLIEFAGGKLERALQQCDVAGDQRTGYWLEVK